jgi:hypothetical protein
MNFPLLAIKHEKFPAENPVQVEDIPRKTFYFQSLRILVYIFFFSR